jgi:3-hydroxyacyl-CoA dehydrogenase
VKDAWLVIECVPEKLEAKIKIFGELVALTREDAILATNSSSYKSSEMLAEVPQESKARVLNMHYYMPPGNMVVELMTDGFTDPAIIEYLVDQSRQVATLPYVARKESTGFIFNRLWAAVKRETLTVLAEGVSTPDEIDSMWSEMFVKGGSLPCKTMDGEWSLAILLGSSLIRRQLSVLTL